MAVGAFVFIFLSFTLCLITNLPLIIVIACNGSAGGVVNTDARRSNLAGMPLNSETDYL